MRALAVVGTRRSTLYGTQMADRLARDLAARGIDAIAHQGTMTANGRAIGVLGTGVDVCYPTENKKLYEKVLERGAMLSEFSLRTHPAPENLPIRNRIVAGMPLGAIIIEGAQYSGSLITARLAMDFGSEVFGVPGNVTQAVSFALNLLIKQGAGRKAGDVRGGCQRGVAHSGSRGADPARATRSRAKQPAAGRVVDRQRAENLRAAQFRRFAAD